MSESTITKLNPDTHLLLDQSLLRLPHELVRRNFKNAQRYIDREREYVLPALKETANATLSSNSTPEQTLASLDAMIARMQTLKRKLESLRTEEEALHSQSFKRIKHLQDLYEIPTLVDVKYDEWSRTRLDRLMVDYLLRTGHTETAMALAETKAITHLIDMDTFISCHKIAASIERGETKEALLWVAENRNALKKLPAKLTGTTTQPPPTSTTSQISNLEFELRLQQYITLLQSNSCLEAITHAQKYLTPHASTRKDSIMLLAGLLGHPANTTGQIDEAYRTFFSPTRWHELSQLFISTHHALFNLPPQPLLHTALTAGLSALKTPACHSVHNPASAATPTHPRIASNNSLCPICSTELNDLARNVPYAHHTKSHVESDAVVLPNHRIYGRARLEELQRKVLRAAGGIIDEQLIGVMGEVTDPTTGETFPWADVKKVYIT